MWIFYKIPHFCNKKHRRKCFSAAFALLRSTLRLPTLAYLLERIEVKCDVILSANVDRDVGIFEEDTILKHSLYVCFVSCKVISRHRAEYHGRLGCYVDNVRVVTCIRVSVAVVSELKRIASEIFLAESLVHRLGLHLLGVAKEDYATEAEAEAAIKTALNIASGG